MNIKYLTVDPSFTRSGVFILTDDVDDSFGFKFFKYDKGYLGFKSLSTDSSTPDFLSLFNRSILITKEFDKLKSCFTKDTKFAMEIPPPGEQFSSGLFMLDSLLLDKLTQYNENITLIPPMAINSYLGSRSVSKSVIVQKTIERISKDFLVNLKSRSINHDEASAFLLYCILKDSECSALRQKVYRFNGGLNGESKSR